ncbi:glycosyltransferase family 4 protein (plasmid) [Cetobacterium somerae]|uniref:glycosyltransferase family 4 protein n=1 Tax=Cetobacterium somerae TaxID=188913 RepID=UPI001F06AD19|nr:glycosyltransferase family 4 protein [Cetobacterium somerae]UPO98527.1 glycosyltransferase family 4 protein [Cetobacterium somerae]
MKILFLCTYYHRAMIFRDLMEALKKIGKNVVAFNAVSYGTKIDKKYENIMDDLVIHRECFSKWDRFFYFYKQKKIFKELIKSVNLKNIEMIHAHTLFNGGYVAYLANKQFKIPYIISVRNTDMNIFLKLPYFKKIANQIIENSLGVQFLSIPYKKLYLEKYCNDNQKIRLEEKSSVIRNGLEEFWINNRLTQEKKIDKFIIKILCVGKIDKNKNLSTTLKAIEILRKVGYEIEFTIVGQVVEKEIFKILKTKNFVKLIKYLNKEELLEVYRKNDIFVMPSINETFGRVYAEAMTQGLPVIYSKNQGFDEIFEDGYIGNAVPSMDADYIAKKILEIKDNYELISKRCIENSGMFNWKNIAAELNNFYKELSNK